MKKLFSSIIMLALCAFAVTSCSDENEENGGNEQPTVEISTGLYVINSGSMGNIDGTITTYDYTTKTAMQNAFKTANGVSLGDTPNDAVVYGSKLYIVVTGENTIEVVNKNTLKSIKQIKTPELMGEDKGKQPRHILAYGGNVYVSTYDGYVAAIDTASYGLVKSYQVGSYPEGMAVSEGKLYVANSSYGDGTNPSISEIDLASGNVKGIKDKTITNPVSIAAIDGALYILDSGTYDASYNQTGAGVRKYSDGKFSKIADATMMAVYGKKLYLVNSPYGASTISYSIYDTTTGSDTPFTPENVFSPSKIAVDPVSGNLFIASLSEDPETHYPSYTLGGYVNIYDKDGKYLSKFNAGLNVSAIVFKTGTMILE